MSEPAVVGRKGEAEEQALEDLPVVGIPTVPDAMTLWTRGLAFAVGVMGLFLLDRLTLLLMDLWLLQSLGQEEVFWTNFRTGAVLFVVGFAGVAFGIARPTFSSRISPEWRRLIRMVALFAGLIAAYLMATAYLEFLGLLNYQPFGKTDPVFDNEIAFYVFWLPAIWIAWWALALPFTLGLVSSALCAALSTPEGKRPAGVGKLGLVLGRMASPGVLLSVGILGVVLAAGVWLSRYDLLWKDNQTSAVFAGAEYVDVVGLFSTLYYYYVTALVTLGLTAVAIFTLRRLRTVATRAGGGAGLPGSLRTAGMAALGLVVLDFSFAGLVTFREAVLVVPNEPVIQLPFIERHIQATLDGYDLEKMELATLVPNRDDAPIPDAQELLASPTLQNVVLWPGWAAYLERVVDPQHADRVLLTGGDSMIYGPTLEILRQQQKLRTYYNFMDVDSVRYEIDGETRLFSSAARELPLDSPYQWLQWWGQRLLLFTHGYGLAMTPVSGIDRDGGPAYASFGIPSTTTWPILKPGNEAIYYGEGAVQMGFSNAEGIREFDRPDDEGRAEVLVKPADTGIVIDSALKRLVIGWRSGNVLDVFFSDMITDTTRVHYLRTPVERAERIAPFLYYEDDPYAIATKDGIVWIVNALATTDRYPYSASRDLGDKSTEQGLTDREEPWRNWVRDAVKVVIDAYTGQVTFYRISDDPVSGTWDETYPGLLRPASEMPDEIRAHLTYPVQMFHTQFDDVYKRYHMKDAMEFFNMEDLWDDGDEVLGPILAEGEAITFSNEPQDWLAETRGALPASQKGTQFVRSMYFTNEAAPNLRAMILAYQDGEDYGRLVDLRVPKGMFYPSPEQADSTIDQTPEISQQINWWNRMGAEVIHGHTNAVIIGNEVVYVAPLFIRSKQNSFSQVKRVVVVLRGHAADGATLEEALTAAVEKARAAQKAQKEPLQTASLP